MQLHFISFQAIGIGILTRDESTFSLEFFIGQFLRIFGYPYENEKTRANDDI